MFSTNILDLGLKAEPFSIFVMARNGDFGYFRIFGKMRPWEAGRPLISQIRPIWTNFCQYFGILPNFPVSNRDENGVIV